MKRRWTWNKENLLRTSMYVAGVVSLVVFIVTKNDTLMYFATAHAYDDGDLYRFAKVREFKTSIPPAVDYERDEVGSNASRVFMVGDSFMDESRGYTPFVQLLSESLKTPVYGVESGNTTENFHLPYFFRLNGIKKSATRVVLLERVERYVVVEFGEPMEENPKMESAVAERGILSFWNTFQDRWFTGAEKDYEYFLASSDVTAPLVESWDTALFHLFGKISDKTPVYSLQPPFLFYVEETDRANATSFYSPHPDSLLGTIADNIEMMNKRLLQEFNTQVVFMPIPNSYTLYHKFVNNDFYDDFLPRLCNAVEKRGVRTVRLYERFSSSDEILYFPTDSHWNEKGMRMALDETLRVLRNERKNVE